MSGTRFGAMILAIVAVAFSATRADYVMPPFPDVLSETTAIVDATVVELLEHGRVRITVHQFLKGSDPPAVLSSAWRTCLGVDLSRRLKLGQRFVFLLYETSLYEENTFYEVRDTDAGPECNCWDGSVRRWMTISEFRGLIKDTQRRP